MKNWKLFGLTICNITIIPCYYDLLRYRRILKNFAVKNLDIVKFSVIAYRFRKLFDTSLI
jgi:hypothetical protein